MTSLNEHFFKLTSKALAWYWSLTPHQQFAVIKFLVTLATHLYKSCHSWYKHWYDTRHKVKKEPNKECHVNNKKEQPDFAVSLFIYIIVRIVHDLF